MHSLTPGDDVNSSRDTLDRIQFLFAGLFPILKRNDGNLAKHRGENDYS